jgi:Rrf2 family cysteine metabolism transcriptional repressor
MKLSTRCRYGARALLEIARNYGRRPTKRRDICKAQGLSDSYLENILISLKSAGVVDTIRGAHGGYVLTRPPAKVSLLDVVKVLEGSQAPVECLDNSVACDRSGRCATQDVWRRVREAEENVLKRTTVQDLVDRDRSYSSADYSI